MYSIQFSDWGLVLEFVGPISDALIQDWLSDLQQLTGGLREDFGVVLDVRNAQPDSPLVSEQLLQGLYELEHAGMVRTAVIVDSDLGGVWAIPESLPNLSGLRRVEAHADAKWLVHAHGWVQRGINPASASNPDSKTPK